MTAENLDPAPEPEIVPNDPPAPDPDPAPQPEPSPSPDPAPAPEPEDTGDKDKPAWGDDWREQMAGGDEDIAKIIKRYSSPRNIAKALKDAQEMIRSGKLKRDAPDPNDEKAMAEWRREQGIPDDPTGYKLPDPVAKRLTDEDKPVLAAFTEFAHGKNAPQSVIDIASEWYVENMEKAAEASANRDREAEEAAEDALRKDWSHADFKANMTLAKRFTAEIPGVGENWTEFRGPDGRRLGDSPDFIMWAADMGRQHFGDVTFANPDSDRRHTARKEEIEKVMKENINSYYEQGLDKEYNAILEREERRRK